MKTLLIDFDDSFTFNISSELFFDKQPHDCIHYTQLENILANERDLHIILGPGPGHPDEYSDIIKLIKKYFTRLDIRWSGICLGHQLIWTSLGAKITTSSNILHGSSQNIFIGELGNKLFGKSLITVQRYNSLCVNNSNLPGKLDRNTRLVFDENGELMLSVGKNFMTYQFHPESIGTSYRNSFFKALNYNNNNAFENRWDL